MHKLRGKPAKHSIFVGRWNTKPWNYGTVTGSLYSLATGCCNDHLNINIHTTQLKGMFGLIMSVTCGQPKKNKICYSENLRT